MSLSVEEKEQIKALLNSTDKSHPVMIKTVELYIKERKNANVKIALNLQYGASVEYYKLNLAYTIAFKWFKDNNY